MTNEEFLARFDGGRAIRVCFDRALFCRECHVKETPRLNDFNRVLSSWYGNDQAVELCYLDSTAWPLSVPDVAKRLDEFCQQRRSRIACYAKRIQNGEEGPFEFPAYALPNGQFMLLDGNHRLVALQKSGIIASVALHVVHGPFDQNILADLWRWQNSA